jgi:hypothetical protein
MQNIIENNLLGKLITVLAQFFKVGQRSKHQVNLQSLKPSTWLRHTQTSGAGHAHRPTEQGGKRLDMGMNQ